MTGLGRWLADVLNRHIRDVEPDPAIKANRDALWQSLDYIGGDNPAAIPRPYWACGNPRGFHAFHLPCWKVPPFEQFRNWERYP